MLDVLVDVIVAVFVAEFHEKRPVCQIVLSASISIRKQYPVPVGRPEKDLKRASEAFTMSVERPVEVVIPATLS